MPRPASLAACALIAAAAIASGASSAAEAPRPSSLGWVRLPGAEACIGPRDLAKAVERRLGRPVFVAPAGAEVFVEGRVEPAPTPVARPAGPVPDLPPLTPPPAFVAHVAISDAAGRILGTRELVAPNGECRALDDQLALVIALLIDPDAALAPERPTPAARRTPARVVVERVYVPEPAPPPREPWREGLSVGAAVVAGLVPKAGFALSLRGEIVPPSFVPIEIGADLFRDATALAPGDAAKGATLSLAYGTIGLCPLSWDRSAVTVRGCADVAVGSLRSVGYGYTGKNGAGQEQAVAHAALAGRAGFRIVGPLELRVGLGLLVPFRRPRFFYVDATGGEQELFRMAPVAGLAEASIGLAFP